MYKLKLHIIHLYNFQNLNLQLLTAIFNITIFFYYYNELHYKNILTNVIFLLNIKLSS